MVGRGGMHKLLQMVKMVVNRTEIDLYFHNFTPDITPALTEKVGKK